ncbi:Pectin methylesterase [Phytophthora cinnamomi]|uniref:Pectin methylesterase n=1 Tax=Phytophthora cinnamomi TaxID=4785 RepID=UPI003559B3E6|nr:Pectin methylesterase [Phytophthora cinnamomi]
MQIFAPLVALVALASGVIADDACSGPNARTTPPKGAIVVDATGSYQGSYKTVSEGVAKLNPKKKGVQTVFVRPGVYNEQVLISPLAGPLVLQGYTCDAKNYASNQVTITQAKAQKDIPAEVKGETRNDMTSTVRFKSDKVKVYNLNIANTAGNVGQALAVNVNATDYGFYACNLTGYQDTVLADKGRELYAKTYINGATDFVFGRYAQAWFESCDIETIGTGFITASGREAANSSATYVFNRARVFGKSGVNSTVLGRPWRPYAKVIWQNSELGDVVKPEGWTTWDATSSTADVVFKEFNNSGPGAVKGSRVAFSGQLDKPVAITEVLGQRYAKEWFVDTSYL